LLQQQEGSAAGSSSGLSSFGAHASNWAMPPTSWSTQTSGYAAQLHSLNERQHAELE